MYTTHLTAGQGMLAETDSLLGLWEDGMKAKELRALAVRQGVFPSMSARRIENVVSDCFAPRYLVDEGRPAQLLKQLAGKLQPSEVRQIQFIYTCRANEVLADFVRQIYWGCYAAGKASVTKHEALEFVSNSIQNGKTAKRWPESTVRRIAASLLGCCADFGLLAEANRTSKLRGDRNIIEYRISRNVALFLCHELHFKPMGDNSVVTHEDWQLFGLAKNNVTELLKSLSLAGHFLVQTAGGIASVGWKHADMQEVINVIH